MPLNLSGQLSLLRVHERGSKYGPPTDQVDVEVIVQFAGRPADAFGFQLRADANLPVREGMLGLLRDGFNHGWVVNIDFDIKPARHNGTIVRVWLTKPPHTGPVIGPIGGVAGSTRGKKAGTARKGAARPGGVRGRKR